MVEKQQNWISMTTNIFARVIINLATVVYLKLKLTLKIIHEDPILKTIKLNRKPLRIQLKSCVP